MPRLREPLVGPPLARVVASLMPTTERDAQALAYLASRLREETHGAGKWDMNGIHAVISKLVGQNLAITIERVTRHAADPEARTPGAIDRPFVPDAAKPRRELDVAPVHSRCQVCGLVEHDCRRLWSADHELRRFEPNTVDISPVITEIKGHLEPTRPPSPPRAPAPRTSHGDAARAALQEREEAV